MTIEQFKEGRDYRDICYVIDHVRCCKEEKEEILQDLGYKIGLNIIGNDEEPKNVTKGKNNEFRVQISPKEKYGNLAKCAIVSIENKKKKKIMKTDEEVKQTEKTTDSTQNTVEVAATDGSVKKEVIELQNLDVEFAKEVMQIPTVSSNEFRMVTFIVLWARRNNIAYEFDTYGNVYLTKGELEEGEFYPCVTSHLDTVQTKQQAYAQAGVPLELQLTKDYQGKHKLSVEGMGIGADCKTGVLISLSLFEHFDKIKAAFFLEEEIGMKGSEHLKTEWFDNVGYVVGWDSPDLNRAAWCCSGTKLFNKQFYEDHLKEVCDKHGLDNFKSEPFTDVKLIREKTDIICMNFGNGGYWAHSATEYMILEDTDHALTMGIDIIKSLGLNQYKMKHQTCSNSWIRMENGTYSKPKDDEDEKYFNKLSGTSYGNSYYDDDYYGGYGRGSYGGGYNSGSTSTSQTTTVKEETVSIQTLKYVANRYDEHINSIKEQIKATCEANGIDFNLFSEMFNESITF